jgi:hypothetical protein
VELFSLFMLLFTTYTTVTRLEVLALIPTGFTNDKLHILQHERRIKNDINFDKDTWNYQTHSCSNSSRQYT